MTIEPMAAADGPPPAALWSSAGPPPAVADAYRSAGWWRTGTFLDDLYRTAAADGTRTALVADRAHHPAGLRLRRLSYAQLAAYVDRYAAALRSLGLRAGDPVAYQLPSWWEAAALTLAVWRIGAVAVPVLPVVRAAGLERILAATQARLCVVPDVWEGHPHAEVLAGLAPRLPWLRRRAVIRTAPGPETAAPAPAMDGALDFDAYFTRTAHERGPHACPPGLPGARPGDPALLITVMALGERFRAVLHSPDTLHAPLAAARTLPGPVPQPGEVFCSALPLTSLASLAHSLCWPLALGGTGVLQDVWDPNRYLDLLAEAGVHQAYASPAQWSEVLTAHRTRAARATRAADPRPALRLILSGGRTPTPPELLAALPEALGAPVRSLWGAPEVALGTLGGVHDPTEGAPLPGLELDSREGGALWVRGPAVAHAVWPFGADRAVLPWEQDEGWLATGDRGDATRVTGRAGHRTGAAFLVPVAELEEALAAHPAVREAAVVEYGDPEHGELPCAVVVPAVEAESPGLVELREWLAGAGLAPAALPTRLELVGSLPRAEDGTLRKDALRAWLSGLRPGAPRTAPQ